MMDTLGTLLPPNEAFKNAKKRFNSPENADKRPSVPDRINYLRPSQNKGKKENDQTIY